jgi:GIY-YIG catalytic domain/NUMOD3 motif
MTTYIYTLIDPCTNEVRYVGQTKDKARRLKDHLTSNRRTHCRTWIRAMQRKGFVPRMVIVETVDDDFADECECWWIEYGRHQGWRLTNHTNGGQGSTGYVPTEEARQRMSIAQLGRHHSEATKEKIGIANRGKVVSEETKIKQSIQRRNDPDRIAHLRKLAVEQRGKKRGPFSEEHKNKISSALKGKAKTEEHRANLSKAWAIKRVQKEQGEL